MMLLRLPLPALLLATTPLVACTPEQASNEEAASAVVGGRDEVGYDNVGYLANYRFEAFCTGTLLTPDTVITAAHCVHSDMLDGYTYFGTGAVAAQKVVGIAQVYRHPGYVHKDVGLPSEENDIAIVRLTRPITTSSPVTIKGAHMGTEFRHIGYGRTVAGDIKVEDPNAGQRKSLAVEITSIEPMLLITKGIDGANCWGDSGGPLFEEGTSNLVGIVSGLMKPPVVCDLGVETGYTNLATFADFIEDASKCDAPAEVSETTGYKFALPTTCRRSVSR